MIIMKKSSTKKNGIEKNNGENEDECVNISYDFSLFLLLHSKSYRTKMLSAQWNGRENRTSNVS